MKGLWKMEDEVDEQKQSILLIPIVFVVAIALAVYAKCSLAEDWKILPFSVYYLPLDWNLFQFKLFLVEKSLFSTINRLSFS